MECKSRDMHTGSPAPMQDRSGAGMATPASGTGDRVAVAEDLLVEFQSGGSDRKAALGSFFQAGGHDLYITHSALLPVLFCFYIVYHPNCPLSRQCQ